MNIPCCKYELHIIISCHYLLPIAVHWWKKTMVNCQDRFPIKDIKIYFLKGNPLSSICMETFEHFLLYLYSISEGTRKGWIIFSWRIRNNLVGYLRAAERTLIRYCFQVSCCGTSMSLMALLVATVERNGGQKHISFDFSQLDGTNSTSFCSSNTTTAYIFK